MAQAVVHAHVAAQQRMYITATVWLFCCRLSEVVGCVRVSRSSKIKPSPLDSSLRALGDLGCAELMQLMASMQLNQRYEFDGTTGEVLTKTDTTRALVLDP